MKTTVEIIGGVLHFPGQEVVRRFPDYQPKWVDLDELTAAFQRADAAEKIELLEYSSKFGLTAEMLHHSEQIFSAYLGRRLAKEAEEFLIDGTG